MNKPNFSNLLVSKNSVLFALSISVSGLFVPMAVAQSEQAEETNVEVANSEVVHENMANAEDLIDEDGSGETDDAALADEQALKNAKPKRAVITLESTIVGDKEQPKVLSIVPWQKADQKPVSSKPINSKIEMTFKPIEVESLQREHAYHEQSKQQ
ncbi:hypothetical protein [Thalassotalea crassostreae]|uniref:hypothetical protein n=1 Tax=Thalassotalea crassostreae TaxID=1763536 RepID=UPI0008A437D2|nr:hypothetical protein [Thalassotalea crassostreae]